MPAPQGVPTDSGTEEKQVDEFDEFAKSRVNMQQSPLKQEATKLDVSDNLEAESGWTASFQEGKHRLRSLARNCRIIGATKQ